MQYNGEANHQDIVTTSEKLVKANSKSFPIAEKTLYANEAVRIIKSWIHEVYGGWMYDDTNYTTLPEATTALTASQADYPLPVENESLKGVSIKDTSGVWHKLNSITLEEIQDHGFAESQFYAISSFPTYYRVTNKSLILYPSPNYTQAASLKIYESRSSSTFSISDTTKVPGFDTDYHEAVPIFMALKHAKINSLPQAGGVMRGGFKTGLLADWGEYENRIKGDYSRRLAERFPPRMKTRDHAQEFS